MKPARPLLAAVLLAAGACRADPAAIERGRQLYEARCTACHSVDADRTGPRHRGVVGRVAGTVAGFDYSPALAASRITWTPQTLSAWLRGPEQLVPGQRMGYRMEDPREIADVVAYLATLAR